MKALLNWITLLLTGIALGSALAAFQSTFDVPPSAMQMAIALITVVALGAAFWVAWRYWREAAKDDDWE